MDAPDAWLGSVPMVSDPRWFTVEMPTPLWELLRDRVVRTAEHEAIRTRVGEGRYSWLRDAWQHVGHERGISTLQLDQELTDLLLKEIKQRHPAVLPDVVAVLPER